MGFRLKSIYNISAIRTYANLATVCDALENRNTLVSELENGFRVATHNNGRATATIGIWVDAGSRYENTSNNGISYFLEHLTYRGTKNRSQKQLQLDLALLGARFDSYTNREHTAYFIQSPSSEVSNVFEILADAVLNSSYGSHADVVEVERKNLLKKLEEYESHSRARVMNYLNMTSFQGTTLALPPVGHKTSIEAITSEDLKKYAKDVYKPIRMVATAVGGVDHDQITNLAKKLFGDLSSSYDGKIPQVFDSCRFTGSEMKYRDDSYPFMYAAFAIEGLPTGHPDNLALQVAHLGHIGQWDMSHATRDNSASELAQDLFNEREIELYEAFNINYKNTGLIGFYLVLKGDDMQDVYHVTKKIQQRWKYFSIGMKDNDVERAKSLYRTQFFTKLETNTQLADHISTELLDTGKVTQLHDIAKQITDIDAKKICTAASNHIYDQEVAIAAIGRVEAWPTYAFLRSGMSYWRL